MGHSNLVERHDDATLAVQAPDRHPATATVSLGEFLRSRRARLSPGDVRVLHSRTRRVPGLRREEVAGLAGLSASYYTRIEQGQVGPPSSLVLESLAAALRLNAAEHAYLHSLAQPRPIIAEPSNPGHATDADIVAAFGVPTVAMSPALDVIAANRAAVRLVNEIGLQAPDEGPRINVASIVFTASAAATNVVGINRLRRHIAGYLRLQLAQHRRPDVRARIEELLAASAPFRELWRQHEVSDLGPFRLLIRPQAGTLRRLDVNFLRGPAPDDLICAFARPIDRNAW